MDPHDMSLLQLRAKQKFVIIWPFMVSLLDICMGLPWLRYSTTFLQVMGSVPESLSLRVMIGWCGLIGVVVGLSYEFTLLSKSRRWATKVWVFTALIHGLAGIALIVLIDRGALPAIWWGVALMGLAVAVVQFATVRTQWWYSVRRQNLKERGWVPVEYPSSQRSPRRQRGDFAKILR
ncbi:MAG: hypothetical protein WCO57_00035 [Verrucomicrobiota bacterium]